jgi:hypothetical protein
MAPSKEIPQSASLEIEAKAKAFSPPSNYSKKLIVMTKL